MAMQLRLGKKPARHGAIPLRFRDYADLSQLPPPPKVFRNAGVFLNRDWGVLGNDKTGNCVWAGAAHETMSWNAEIGHPVVFDEKSVLSDYSAQTGYVPGKPETDHGTDMAAAAAYRQKTGIIDASGVRHVVQAYVALRVHDVHEAKLACWMFGGIGFGFECQQAQLDQFNAGQPWTYVADSKVVGGHYVPILGQGSSGRAITVTWGGITGQDDSMWQLNDESIAYVSKERLTKLGITREGFRVDDLLADIENL